MPTIGTTTRPAYVYDLETDTWIPVGTGPHTHTVAISDVTGLQAALDAELSLSNYNAAGKNFALNGSFDWWQRGTSFTGNGVYTADRWFYSYGGTVTLAQETTVVQDGSSSSARLTTGAASSFGELYQAFESLDVNLMAGKTITISGSVRAGSAVAYVGSAVIGVQTNGTANVMSGGTWTEQSSTTQAPSTSAWTRFSLTYTIPAGTKGLRIRLGNTSVQPSGTILYWSNIQVEIGSVATPFSRAAGTIQGELAACQRYYYRQTAPDVYSNFGTGWGNGTTASRITLYLPVPMRVKPSSSIEWANLALYDGASIIPLTALTIGENNTHAPALNASAASGITNFRPYSLISNNTTNAYLGLTAEL